MKRIHTTSLTIFIETLALEECLCLSLFMCPKYLSPNHEQRKIFLNFKIFFHFSPRSQQRSLDLKFKRCLLSQIICERKVNFCWKRRGRLFHRSIFCGNDTFFRKTCGKLSILVIEKVIWNDLDSKMNLKLTVSKTS